MLAQQPGKGIGHFLGAMRIDAFRPADVFKKDMDHWIEGFRNATPVEGQSKVLVPGDPERLAEKERMQEGIPLHEVVIQDLQALGQQFELPFE
jgi:LDH2 family malate/lactate/ureidoglycolate dehydrogenase